MPDLAVRDSSDVESVLRRRIAALEHELADAKLARDEAQRESTALAEGVKRIRRQLSPMHEAMKLLFGELDQVTFRESGASEAVAPSVPASTWPSPVWDSWKSRLGARCGYVIDFLLIHQNVTVTQIGIALHSDKRTIRKAIARMTEAGIISRSGARVSLKVD